MTATVEYVTTGHVGLPVYRPTDPDIARARNEAKAARMRGFYERQAAADKSQTREGLARAARENRVAPVRGAAPCKGTCGRLTRPTHTKAADYPDKTIMRVKGGMCEPCANGGRVVTPRKSPVRPCAGCGKPTRPTSARKEAYPNTRIRRTADLCGNCDKKRKRELAREQVAA